MAQLRAQGHPPQHMERVNAALVQRQQQQLQVRMQRRLGLHLAFLRELAAWDAWAARRTTEQGKWTQSLQHKTCLSSFSGMLVAFMLPGACLPGICCSYVKHV